MAVAVVASLIKIRREHRYIPSLTGPSDDDATAVVEATAEGEPTVAAPGEARER